jgi:hypothetical protein
MDSTAAPVPTYDPTDVVVGANMFLFPSLGNYQSAVQANGTQFLRATAQRVDLFATAGAVVGTTPYSFIQGTVMDAPPIDAGHVSDAMTSSDLVYYCVQVTAKGGALSADTRPPPLTWDLPLDFGAKQAALAMMSPHYGWINISEASTDAGANFTPGAPDYTPYRCTRKGAMVPFRRFEPRDFEGIHTLNGTESAYQRPPINNGVVYGGHYPPAQRGAYRADRVSFSTGNAHNNACFGFHGAEWRESTYFTYGTGLRSVHTLPTAYYTNEDDGETSAATAEVPKSLETGISAYLNKTWKRVLYAIFLSWNVGSIAQVADLLYAGAAAVPGALHAPHPDIVAENWTPLSAGDAGLFDAAAWLWDGASETWFMHMAMYAPPPTAGFGLCIRARINLAWERPDTSPDGEELSVHARWLGACETLLENKYAKWRAAVEAGPKQRGENNHEFERAPPHEMDDFLDALERGDPFAPDLAPTHESAAAFYNDLMFPEDAVPLSYPRSFFAVDNDVAFGPLPSEVHWWANSPSYETASVLAAEAAAISKMNTRFAFGGTLPASGTQHQISAPRAVHAFDAVVPDAAVYRHAVDIPLPARWYERGFGVTWSYKVGAEEKWAAFDPWPRVRVRLDDPSTIKIALAERVAAAHPPPPSSVLAMSTAAAPLPWAVLVANPQGVLTMRVVISGPRNELQGAVPVWLPVFERSWPVLVSVRDALPIVPDALRDLHIPDTTSFTVPANTVVEVRTMPLGWSVRDLWKHGEVPVRVIDSARMHAEVRGLRAAGQLNQAVVLRTLGELPETVIDMRKSAQTFKWSGVPSGLVGCSSDEVDFAFGTTDNDERAALSDLTARDRIMVHTAGEKATFKAATYLGRPLLVRWIVHPATATDHGAYAEVVVIPHEADVRGPAAVEGSLRWTHNGAIAGIEYDPSLWVATSTMDMLSGEEGPITYTPCHTSMLLSVGGRLTWDVAPPPQIGDHCVVVWVPSAAPSTPTAWEFDVSGHILRTHTFTLPVPDTKGSLYADAAFVNAVANSEGTFTITYLRNGAYGRAVSFGPCFFGNMLPAALIAPYTGFTLAGPVNEESCVHKPPTSTP